MGGNNMMMNILEALLKFLENPREKMERLKRKADALESREDDIRTELSHSEASPAKRPKKSVENWLSRVGVMKSQVLDLEQKLRQLGIFGRFEFSFRVDRVSTEVTELSQWPFPGELTTLDANRGLEFPAVELVGERFRAAKRTILESLKTENGIDSVGIYGMGGIGKSTLITHLHNDLLKVPETSVVWVGTASRDRHFSVRRLQSDLARALGISLDAGDERQRAAGVLRELRRRSEKVVIFLDDLWEPFCLERVGIRVGPGCKIVLATRSSEICDRMGCRLKVEISPLDDGDSWELFAATLRAGSELFSSSSSRRIEDSARRVARECGGLPLGLVAMAGSMRGVDDPHEWSAALEAMRSPVSPTDSEIQKVFRVLRYSYDALESETTRECFLYCALFPKDFRIRREDLVKYFVDEGLVRGDLENHNMLSREAEINRGHSILNKLGRACLLQGGSKWKYLKMHDLVREMAIGIANEKCRFWVEAGLSLVADVGDEEKWSAKGLRRVSFVGRFLPDALSSAAPPKSPKILTLLFRDCYNVTAIPDSFFANMDSLTILDLSRTGICSLPSSVSGLTGLTALLLGSCRRIEQVVPLSSLTALKRLDLSCTGIRELPEGIEMLTDLRELNLHGAKNLRNIPVGILPRLSRLQVLMLPKLKMGKAMVEEIAGLRRLEKFKAEYYSVGDLDAVLRSWEGKNPDEFVLLGDEVLCRDLCDVSDVARYVSVKKCDGLCTLCELDSLQNARGLKTCYVGECDRMVRLFCRGCYHRPFFGSLEIVCLESLSRLRSLVGDGASCVSSSSRRRRRAPDSGSFFGLKGFRIYKCPEIESLFTPELVSGLGNLETLKVCFCDNLAEIVRGEEEEGLSRPIDYGSLPNLKLLKLWGLPKLKSFFRGSRSQTVSFSLQEIDISDCPILESLPLAGDFALKELTVKRCHSLKSLFTLTQPSLCLENLERLVVHDCEELAEIVRVSPEKVDQKVNAFPRLKVLKMQSLPRLESFCRSEKLVSDSVEEVSIINCPNLKRFPLIGGEERIVPASIRSITVEKEWWGSIEFGGLDTKYVLRPMCDFRHRF